MNFKKIKSFFCVMAAFFSLVITTPAVTLIWNPSPDATNGLPNPVSGYNVYYGVASRSYDHVLGTSNTNLFIANTNFITNATYYFAVTATNVIGDESDFSNEAVWTNSVGAPQIINFVGVKVDYGLNLTAINSTSVMVMAVTNHPDWFYNESLILTNNPVTGGTAPIDGNSYLYIGTLMQYGSNLTSLTTTTFPLLTFTNPPSYFYRSSLIITNNPFGTTTNLLVSSGNLPSSLTNGLILRWAFDENTGTTTADSSTNKLVGTLVGTNLPAWSPSYIGISSLSFDGISSMVTTVTNAITQPNSGDFSFALWFNTTTKVNNGIIGGESSATGVYYILEIQNTTGNLIAGVQAEHGQPSSTQTSGINYADGNWHHAVLLYDGTTLKTSLYVDGVFVSTATTATSGICDPNASFTIGNVTKFNAPFNGLVDDVRLYSRKLTSTEISQLATQSHP